MSKNLITFMSGRLVTLVIVLAFQIVLVRVLPAAQYAAYALVFAFATLMQTTVSFGIPRVIAKYVTKAGWSLSFLTVRRLVVRLVVVRVGASAVLILLCWLGARWTGLMPDVDPWLVPVSVAYILVGLVQMDADAMAQALSLQRVSRACSIAEAGARLLLVLALAAAGFGHYASEVVAVCFATFGTAAAVLLTVVLRTLSVDAPAADERPLDWAELRRTGLSGYASSMAWFASSPAVIRLIGGSALALRSFAGFAFAQSLVISFQRYTPAFLLLPFVEPTAMRDYDRTGDQRRLEAVLSLVSKIDIILIGSTVVGTGVAGEALVALMTGGKYTAEAFALPWLLVYILTTSVYRSFEITAIALGAAGVLVRTLSFSLVWLAAAVLLTGRYGLIVLLVCPVGDALSRLGVMYRALVRRGIRHVVDVPVVLTAFLFMALATLAGRLLIALLAPGLFGMIALGSAAALAYLAAICASRPFRTTEAAFLPSTPGRPWASFAKRLIRQPRPTA